MNKDNEHILWVEAYRPKTIDECILPDNLKQTFQTFIENGTVPNLVLAGPPGIGKTTVARALCEQLNSDYIIINGSLNGNIDTLRNDILAFASTMSFSGGRKYVILDEADYLTNQTQPALRNFIEQYARTCGFILTCNYVNKIIEPLRSRCSVIDFAISKKETLKLAGQFFKRVCTILENEKIQYDKAIVAKIIENHYPDWRRVLNELQRYSVKGTIDSGILASSQTLSINELIGYLKLKNYEQVRHWVIENINNDHTSLFRSFYDNAKQFVSNQYIPILVMLIAKYQYQSVFAVDQEVNTMAFFAECMVSVEFI